MNGSRIYCSVGFGDHRCVPELWPLCRGTCCCNGNQFRGPPCSVGTLFLSIGVFTAACSGSCHRPQSDLPSQWSMRSEISGSTTLPRFWNVIPRQFCGNQVILWILTLHGVFCLACFRGRCEFVIMNLN